MAPRTAKVSGGSAARLEASETRLVRKSPVHHIVEASTGPDLREVIDAAYSIHGAAEGELTRVARNGIGRALVEVFRAGMAMLEYQNTHEHGSYVKWLKDEVGIPVSTAYKYVSCARVVPALYQSGNFHNVETFTLERVLSEGRALGILTGHAGKPAALPSGRKGTRVAETSKGDVRLSPALVGNVLREHDLRVPKDIFCACGVQFLCHSFEEGRDLWIEHVLEIMANG